MKFIKEKIGSICSAILLGNTKDLIIRTDEAVKRIDRDFDNVKEDVKSIDRKLAGIEPKVGALWEKLMAGSSSPRYLNEEGERVFKESGIKIIIDEKLNELISEVEKLSPQTAYDAERFTESVMYSLRNNPSLIKSLKDGAYETGVDIDIVLFVGSIYLRDKYLEKHPELLKNEPKNK